MDDTDTTSVECDLLLFVATITELAALESAAKALGLTFDKQKTKLGECYALGMIGQNRTVAVKTTMGSLGHTGSTARALLYRNLTGATGIVCLGMAFGVRREQNFGDVLVSTSILPYDDRKVVGTEDGYDYSYDDRFRSYPAKPSLRYLFERAAETQRDYKVYPGAMLSGGARIRSIRYRDMLVDKMSAAGHDVVGGEMEGAGLLATSTPGDSRWIVVKGISDFAEDVSEDDTKTHRQKACDNSAMFVLQALAAEPQSTPA